MNNPGAPLRPAVDAMDMETRAMFRALLLCELIEQIDAAAAANTARRAAPRPWERAARAVTPALDAMVEIRAALDRLDDGTFGLCETCRTPIPIGDLRSTPSARLCATCRPRHDAGRDSRAWPRRSSAPRAATRPGNTP